MLIHDSFSSIGVTGAIRRSLLFDLQPQGEGNHALTVKATILKMFDIAAPSDVRRSSKHGATDRRTVGQRHQQRICGVITGPLARYSFCSHE